MTGVAILGCGVVGSGTVKMLMENRDRIVRASGVDVRLRAVLDVRPVQVPQGVLLTSDFDEILRDPEIKIIAETIGGTGAAYDYTKRALLAGKSIVTSNKELVSAHGDEFEAIGAKMGVRYLYEAAAGGAIPIIRPINLCLGGNHFREIAGVVNGSTNYLLTRMEDQGISFPTALMEAQSLGYVEADPSADVDGHDARRKIAILAHEAFGSRFDDCAKVPCEGIRSVTQEDIRAAELFGGRVKLVARAGMRGETWSGSVRPCFVAQGHPLYDIRDVFNAVLLDTDFAGKTVITGRGAGSMPTASAVVGDIIDAAKNPAAYPKDDFVPAFRAEKQVSRFVVRVDDAIPEALKDCEVRRTMGILAMMTGVMEESELQGLLAGVRHGLLFPVL